jgi:hypothetical protein
MIMNLIAPCFILTLKQIKVLLQRMWLELLFFCFFCNANRSVEESAAKQSTTAPFSSVLSFLRIRGCALRYGLETDSRQKQARPSVGGPRPAGASQLSTAVLRLAYEYDPHHLTSMHARPTVIVYESVSRRHGSPRRAARRRRKVTTTLLSIALLVKLWRCCCQPLANCAGPSNSKREPKTNLRSAGLLRF